MATDQHQVIATPKDRWALSLFLLRKGHSFVTRKEQQVLHRAKNALDLHGPINGCMAEGQGLMELADDETPALFEVHQETVKLFTALLDKVKEPPMLAHEMAALEPVVQQLESAEHAAKVVAEHPDAKPLDPKSERWVRTSAPILRNPGRFVDVVAELIKQHPADPAREPSWAAFQRAYLEEAEVPKPGKTHGGRLQPATDLAPS